MLGLKRVDYVELETVLKEIPLILNNRSLCEPVDEDVERLNNRSLCVPVDEDVELLNNRSLCVL